MLDGKEQAMSFEVGDEVIVTYNIYHWTKPGSYGTIHKIMANGKLKIKWKHITGLKNFHEDMKAEYMRRSIDWEIEPHTVDLHGDINIPYFKVIRKIKQMDQVRKEKGYAF